MRFSSSLVRSLVRTEMSSSPEFCTTARGKPASETASRATSMSSGRFVEYSTMRPPVNSTP